MLKRAFDLLGAGVGLFLLAPLIVVLALCVKLDSPGPVFFRQVRVGRYGKHFRIFKFRTMCVVQSPQAAQITVAGDSRITRTGAWMRRWKLDELPQLLDVLRGTMSLVGPRPEVPRYVEHYPPAWRERLLSVRPGITDFASVRYRNESELLARAADPEAEYIDVVLPTKLRYALHYVENPSLTSDLQVLGLTLRTVFVPNLPTNWNFLPMRNSGLWRWLDHAMSALNPRNRTIATLADALVILACWHITYLFRLGFERWQPGRPWYDDYVSLGVTATYLLAMALTGVPRGLWRFFGFDDFKRIAVGCLIAGTLGAAGVLLLQLVGVARAVLVLHPLFCILALSLSRMAYRMLWEHARACTNGSAVDQKRAIVLGAGEAGRRLISTLHQSAGWTVLTILDDDPAKQGLRVAGVTVGGTVGDLALPHVLAGATHVIVAMPSVSAKQHAAVLDMARLTGLPVLTVPSRAGLREDDRSADRDDVTFVQSALRE